MPWRLQGRILMLVNLLEASLDAVAFALPYLEAGDSHYHRSWDLDFALLRVSPLEPV